MMKFFGSWRGFTSFITVSGVLFLAKAAADGVNEFRRCYNTSVEMHCFDLQFDTINNRWLTASFDNARQRCNKINSTLLVIKDEETNNIVQSYFSDPSSPISNQYAWMDAYQINDFNNTYTWHWLNSKLPNLAASEVTYLFDYTFYVTTLEIRSDYGKLSRFLTAKQPQFSYSYICEYAVSRCSSTGSNVFQFADRCYISFITSVPWYEARNRCLKDGGDLASFANVTSINFTSWLGSDPNVRFWIGLRFSWYIWKDSGEDVKFSKWSSNDDLSSRCLIGCSNCTGTSTFAWLPKDCSAADNIYVVCHSVTPLPAKTLNMTSTTTVSVAMKTLTSTSTTTVSAATSANIKTQTGTTQSNSPGSNSSRFEKSSGSKPIALAVGVGVGVGILVIVAIIVIVICVLRSGKHLEQKTRNDRTELGAVQSQSVEQVNDSTNDNNYYQHLNRNLHNSSGSMYDKLRVAPNPNYENFPPNNTNT